MKLSLFLALLAVCSSAYCDQVVWSGKVSSDGSPSKSITLDIGKQYQIKSSGIITLGNWKKNGEELVSDTCYLFGSDENSITKTSSLKNSADINLCEDGKYHPNHVYTSFPFSAKQERIHFWVHDTIYGDNIGSLAVEVIEIN